MRLLLALALLFAAGVALAAPGRAWAQGAEPALVGTFSDWTAWTYMDGRNKVCYIASTPLDKQPRNVNRGDVYVSVAHKPGVRDEVSFISGYSYDANAVVVVTVDATEFKLFAKDDTAWTYTKEDDARMARAMTAGTRMIVKGKSNRGTETTDSYSLSGFTAAHQAMDRACPAR